MQKKNNTKYCIMKNEESKLQRACVRWFRLQFPELSGNLWAIGNGGNRDVVTGYVMKLEGVLAGVADLMLCVPNEEYHGLFIEMKTAKGRQSESQRLFQINHESKRYSYKICRSFDEFKKVVENYIKFNHKVK